MKIAVSIYCAVALLCGCSSGPSWQSRTFSFSVPVDPPGTNVPTNVIALNRISISPIFQTRSFTYRTGENSYEKDPYAGFIIPPERTLAEAIRGWMRAGGAFGRVLEPGSGLAPTQIAEITISELYGDFRNSSQPVGRMELHFVCYGIEDGTSRRVILDRVCARETPLAKKTADALMVAWDTDLREIMEEINSEYAKAK